MRRRIQTLQLLSIIFTIIAYNFIRFNISGVALHTSLRNSELIANGSVPAMKKPPSVRFNDTWHQRYEASKASGSGGGFLYFKHIRKAGGTTLRTYFHDVLEYHGHSRPFSKILNQLDEQTVRARFDRSAVDDYMLMTNKNFTEPRSQMPGYQIHYIEQEFDAMDSECPKIDARWKDSLRIVTLRHPIERIMSEFFFSGPGRYHPINRTDLHTNETYTRELGEILNNEVAKWTKNNYAYRREDRGNIQRKNEIQKPFGRYYTDNFQLRSLAGCSSSQCLEGIQFNAAEIERNSGQLALLQSHQNGDTSIDSKCTLHFFDKERMLDVCNKLNKSTDCPHGCDAPCFYPTTAWGPINATHVERAVETLKEFDAILLMETFTDQDQSAMLSDIMGVSRDVDFALSNIETRNSGVQKSNDREKTHFYRDLLATLAPEVGAALNLENALELQFFEEAVKLNGLRTELWKAEVDWTD